LELQEKAPVTAMSVKMRIEIISYGRGFYKGKLISQYLDEPYEFFTLVRMIEKMEEIFDDKKFPQAFLAPRSFNDKKGKSGKKTSKRTTPHDDGVDMTMYEGPGHGNCTFDVLVRFRQNASWQGVITWVEKDMKQNFRSELEMLRLMDEALIDFETDSEQITWEM